MALSYSSMENIKVVLIWGWWWLFSHDGFPQQIFFDEFYNDLCWDRLARQGSINISKKEVCQHFLNVYKSKLNNSGKARLLARAASLPDGGTQDTFCCSVPSLPPCNTRVDIYGYIQPWLCLAPWSLTTHYTTCGTKVMSIKLMKVLSSPSFYLSRPNTSYFCLSKPVCPL